MKSVVGEDPRIPADFLMASVQKESYRLRSSSGFHNPARFGQRREKATALVSAQARRAALHNYVFLKRYARPSGVCSSAYLARTPPFLHGGLVYRACEGFGGLRGRAWSARRRTARCRRNRRGRNLPVDVFQRRQAARPRPLAPCCSRGTIGHPDLPRPQPHRGKRGRRGRRRRKSLSATSLVTANDDQRSPFCECSCCSRNNV